MAVVAEDRVVGAREVAADLVAAAGGRRRLDERVARRLVRPHRPRLHRRREQADLRAGVLWLGGGFQPVPVGVQRDERAVYRERFRWVAAHDGEVGLLDAALGERRAQKRRGLLVEREAERAARGAVEAVDGPDVAAERVADALERGARGAVERGAVDEQPRRLVDDDEPLVLVQDRERPVVPLLGRYRPAHAASTSATVFGMGLPRTRAPSAVTSTSSSMRTPPKPSHVSTSS